MWESNPRPLGSQPSALSAELKGVDEWLFTCRHHSRLLSRCS
jgi:hypothetical protein